MNLYELKHILEKQEKAVFSLNEIARIIKKSRRVAAVYAYRMCKRDLLFKIEKNKFSLSDDIFIIASQLCYPSYLGLTTSLYLNNILPQVIDKVYVVTPKQKRKIKVFGSEIIFIKLKPALMFGYKKIKKASSYIFVSDIEKTVIDCLLLNYCHLNTVIEILRKAEIEKLEYYLSLVNREYVNRKIGYLLDCLGARHNLQRKTMTVYKLNPSSKRKGKFNNKWFLYINEDVR